jgi:lauroyl/myristoyl acyltransferase
MNQREATTTLADGVAAIAPTAAARPKLCRASDVAMLLRLPVEVPLAWLLPEASLRRLALAMAQRWRADLIARTAARAEAVLGARALARPLAECALGHAANAVLVELSTLRCWRPGGWQPDVHLEGRVHLERALEAGHGAILWSAPFVFTGLLAKMTLHQSGVAVSHLSRYRHGFSPTSFGVHVLNPLRTRIEARYLAERLVIRPGASAGGLRLLRRRLRENRVVSITLLPIGGRIIEVPFLDAKLRVASGAPTLALRTGAALLPIYTITPEPGRYVTTIEPALAIRADLDERSGSEDLLAQYATRIERLALRWPGQFAWCFAGLIPVRSGPDTVI